MMNLHTQSLPWTLSCLLLLWGRYAAAQGGGGIPGTSQTLSGYDTEMGVDSVCWRSTSAKYYAGVAYPFPNPLAANFSVAGNIELLKACPTGNTITAYAPVERETLHGAKNFNRSRLRTHTWYNFPVRATFNLTSLDRMYFVSDWGPTVAFQVILCINGVSGFCSPFIHEEANDRIVRGGGVIAPVARGDQHGRTHVHSPYVLRNLTFEDGPIYEIQVEVPMLVNDEADFYAIAATQFFLGNAPDDISMRVDMANAIVEGQRLLTYQDPFKVLEVPTGVLLFCHVLRAVSAAVIVFLLVQTIYHRNHQVLKLSQQPFLVVFLLAALTATLGSILLEPKNDFYCRWSSFVVISSLHIVVAVTAGRMWRINAVISPLLAQTLRRRQSTLNRVLRRMFKKPMGSRSNIRREFQPWHLTAAITIFTAPAVLLLLAASIWQEQALRIDLNLDKSVGRNQCYVDVPRRHSLLFYGFFAFVGLIGLLLCMAHMTRHLPSLFNETEVIFNTALTSLVVLALGSAVVMITDDPETSPGVAYLTLSVEVFFITLNSTCRIVLPKLQMVWRGKTVLVSKLVADHARAVREDDKAFLSKGSNGEACVRVTGLDANPASFSNTTPDPDESNSQAVAESLNKFEKTSSVSVTDVRASEDSLGTPSHSSAQVGGPSVSQTPVPMGGDDLSRDGDEPKSLQSRSSANPRRVGFKDNSGLSRKSNSGRSRYASSGASSRQPSDMQPLLIRLNETPSKRLVLKMYHLQEHLAHINQQILSGAAVSKADWEKLRRLSTRMGDTFHSVDFDWTPDQHAEETFYMDGEAFEEEQGRRNI